MCHLDIVSEGPRGCFGQHRTVRNRSIDISIAACALALDATLRTLNPYDILIGDDVCAASHAVARGIIARSMEGTPS